MNYTYRTGGYGDNLIERLEVVKETDKQVTIRRLDEWSSRGGATVYRESREAKRSNYQNHFGAFDEAKAFLMAQCDGRIRSYQSCLDTAKAQKQKINNLQEAKTTPERTSEVRGCEG